MYFFMFIQFLNKKIINKIINFWKYCMSIVFVFVILVNQVKLNENEKCCIVWNKINIKKIYFNSSDKHVFYGFS